MNMTRMLNEIFDNDINWRLGKDSVRGIFMHNALTGVAFYGDTVDDVVRKVWLSIYLMPAQVDGIPTYTLIPHSHGMVKG